MWQGGPGGREAQYWMYVSGRSPDQVHVTLLLLPLPMLLLLVPLLLLVVPLVVVKAGK